MRNNAIRVLVAASIAVMVFANQAYAASQQTVLKLGGSYCEYYPKEVTAALMAVKGVTSVDLTSKPGNAVVIQDGSVSPDKLVAAVNGVKSSQWFCTGELVK